MLQRRNSEKLAYLKEKTHKQGGSEGRQGTECRLQSDLLPLRQEVYGLNAFNLEEGLHSIPTFISTALVPPAREDRKKL